MGYENHSDFYDLVLELCRREMIDDLLESLLSTIEQYRVILEQSYQNT